MYTKDPHVAWFVKSVVYGKHARNPEGFAEKTLKKASKSPELASRLESILGVHPYHDPEGAKRKLVRMARTQGKYDLDMLSHRVATAIQKDAQALGKSPHELVTRSIIRKPLLFTSILGGFMAGEAMHADETKEKALWGTGAAAALGVGAGRTLFQTIQAAPHLANLYKDVAREKGHLAATMAVAKHLLPIGFQIGATALGYYMSARGHQPEPEPEPQSWWDRLKSKFGK